MLDGAKKKSQFRDRNAMGQAKISINREESKQVH